ncbi:hypothetical protein [Armatimonas rosea]|uniref:Uncharacterized protein n=1 Tax=Armatimonas rosea TaxID=685828 RepID=A0A7W9SQP4_ARMRO|nr:hypothetical protein [Armatimonas rosea]MBB6051052.1 hypothetical protein [Armatimonas rosea]
METTTETTTKKKTTTPYGAIDKRFLAELQLAEELLQAAQAPQHNAALAEGGITTAELQRLAETIASCRVLFTGAVDEKVQKKTTTSEESATESKLRRLIRGVQTAARLKYAGL